MVRGGGAVALLAATCLLLGAWLERGVLGVEDDKDLEGLPCSSICTIVDTSPHCNRCRDREPLRFGKRVQPLGHHLPLPTSSPTQWSHKKRRLRNKSVGDLREQRKQRTSSAATATKATLDIPTPAPPIPSKNVHFPARTWSTFASTGNRVSKPVMGGHRTQKRFLLTSYGKRDPKVSSFGRHLLGMFKKDAGGAYPVAKSVNWPTTREPMRFGKRTWLAQGSSASPFDFLAASLSKSILPTTASSSHTASTASSGVSSNRPVNTRPPTRRVLFHSFFLRNQTKRSVSRYRLKPIGHPRDVGRWHPMKAMLSTKPFYKLAYVRPEFKRVQLRPTDKPEPTCTQSDSVADGEYLKAHSLGKALVYLRRTPMG